jgi:hypothetical protein
MIAVVRGAAPPARNTNRASIRHLRAVVVMSLVALTAVNGCGSSRREQPARPATSFPADQDAITVLASTATQVAIETVAGPCQFTSGYTPCLSNLKAVSILQGNTRPDFGDATPSHIHDLIAAQLFEGVEFKVKPGDSYLVFASFDRGMTGCISALYRYHVNSKTATFIVNEDGPSQTEIRLPGRTLQIPKSMSLDYVLARMNPSGGQVYPKDTAEWFCPGP